MAILAGQKEVTGAVGLTVKNCRFENVGFGVWTEYAGSSDFYIADNLFLGREDRFRLIGWTGPLWASAGAYGSHAAHELLRGQGLRPGTRDRAGMRSPTSTTASASRPTARPESDPERRASSIDIYGNDIHISNDDFIETDGGVHNIRVFGNRGVNAAHGGYSAQPVFGGPVYFIRNLLYHVPSGVAFKFSAKPAGLFVWHNTIIGEQTARDPSANVHFRNNLVLGRDTPERGVMTWANATSAFSSDYNGYRPNASVTAQFAWLAPARRNGVRGESGALEDVPIARRVARGHRPGGARRRSRLRRVRAHDAAGSGEAARRLSRHGPGLPDQAVGRGGRRGCAPADGERRLRGAAPDLGALEAGERRRTMGRAG